MSDDTVIRKLTAILYADVAGYSRLTGADEVGTHKQLAAGLDLISGKIEETDGRVVHYAGDAVLAEFQSVVAAVEAAVDIQQSLAKGDASIQDDKRLEFRIGVNLGEVILDRDDIYGDGVNVAARLESLAEPGGICISRKVLHEVRDKLQVGFEFLGEQAVKNIVNPIPVYKVLLAPEAVGKVIGETLPRSQRPGGRSIRMAAVALFVFIIAGAGTLAWLQPWKSDVAIVASSLSAKTSIAVLPFSNLSQDPDQDYFSDGFTNDLITDLSKFQDLFVIASNSVFTYKGKAVKVQDVGRDLGVRFVLEGSVQRHGERVRINAQLIDARDGKHLWAERYDEATTNLFDLQDQITKNIVSALAIRLTNIERNRAIAKPTKDLQAYDYVLRGQHLLSRLTQAANFDARELFRKAINLDSGYADAYTGLGWSYLNAFLFGWSHSPGEAIKRAEKLVLDALSINPSSAGGHRLQVRIHMNRHKHDLALAELERAISINPNDARNHSEQGIVFAWLSRPDEAINSLETALRFDPRMNSESLAHLGMAYYLKTRYEDAIKVLEKSTTQTADFLFAHQLLAASYGQLGNVRAATREAEIVRRFAPFFDAQEFGGNFRDPADARRVINGLLKAGL